MVYISWVNGLIKASKGFCYKMKRTYISFITIFFLVSINAWAQQKYWIYFNTQDENPFDAQIEEIGHHGVKPIVISRWLFAVSAYLDDHQKKAISQLRGIDRIKGIDKNIRVFGTGSMDSVQFSRALDQIHAGSVIQSGLSGKGVKIGIIDGGFYQADKDASLSQLVDNRRVAGYKNFIETGTSDPYVGPRKNNDYHGTAVWKAIAGRTNKKISGLATGATFYLARTDQADKEYRGEEDYWVEALEWMHSQGVRLVNSSVGYSNGYDDPTENYLPVDVDGKSSAITQAARIASEEKGMLIVISAGNDGSNAFQVISVPADAKGVLTVGATGYHDWRKAGYSSIGPQTLNHIKPDISCYASSGTSFSAPVITGLAACMMEAKPELSNLEIKDLVIQSAHLYDYPNNYVGHGVPDAKKIMAILSLDEVKKVTSFEIMTSTSSVSVDYEGLNIVAFHKSDSTTVFSQERLSAVKGKVTVNRQEGIAFTTIATPGKVWEIHWEQ